MLACWWLSLTNTRGRQWRKGKGHAHTYTQQKTLICSVILKNPQKTGVPRPTPKYGGSLPHAEKYSTATACTHGISWRESNTVFIVALSGVRPHRTETSDKFISLCEPAQRRLRYEDEPKSGQSFSSYFRWERAPSVCWWNWARPAERPGSKVQTNKKKRSLQPKLLNIEYPTKIKSFASSRLVFGLSSGLNTEEESADAGGPIQFLFLSLGVSSSWSSILKTKSRTIINHLIIYCWNIDSPHKNSNHRLKKL